MASDNLILTCITHSEMAWRALKEATQVARIRKASLTILICLDILRCHESEEETKNFMDKFNHAALQSCDEFGINLVIEVIDCGNSKTTCLSKRISEFQAELLILTDANSNGFFDRILPNSTEAIAKLAQCSVLVIR